MLIHIKAAQELKECCRKRDAWQQIIDFANYPEVIPQVDAIRIFEQNPHHVRSEWSITLDGAPFSWIEIAAPQQEQFVINSEAISGDFDTLRGKWKIEDSENEGIKLLYFLEYELGIPVIEENCRDILMAKMQQYITTLVEKQGSRIRKQTSEQRRFKRVPLNRFCSFSIDRRIIEANIQNVSRGGMMINLSKGMLETDPYRQTELQLAAVSSLGRLVFDQYYNAHRIIFQEPLEESDFRSLYTRWADGSDISGETVRIYEVMTAQSSAVSRQYSKMSAG